ncbi:MAG: tRNA(adenine34) deaminase [Bradyrhizobium sp.]
MHARTVTNSDYRLMRRCLELSQRSVEAGEYPYGVVIARHGETIVEGLNCVARDRDVTRHAELVAISEAQRTLGTSSLEDCAIYSSTEPCALCSYAIRESRIGKVVYGLSSPIMGGVSRWNILEDEHLSRSIPEVFAPPPIVLHCFLCDEAEHAMRRAAPVSSAYLRCRGILTAGTRFRVAGRPQTGMRHRLVRFTRRTLFDRFGRHFHDRA